MDQLDLLKKDWKKQDASLPKLSQSELSKLVHKKSSSIVKWIFIISLLELILPHIALLFVEGESSESSYEKLGLRNFGIVIYALYYPFVFYFIYRFYKNYKSISASSQTKELMQNIIKTRKTVKTYIWISVITAFIIFVVAFYKVLSSDEFLQQLPENTNILIVWAAAIFLVIAITSVFLLFYSLIYGILLRKLKANYKELVKDINSL